MEQLKDKVVVPVLDHKGNRLKVNVIGPGGKVTPNGADLERVLWNAPWHTFFPELPFVIIDWTTAMAETKKKAKELGETYESLMADVIMTPIEYDGKLWYGGWYWGSAVKNNQTIAVTEDVLLHNGFLSCTEDGQRAARAYFCNGLYGGLVSDSMRVLVVPDRYVWDDKYRVGDGNSLFAIEDFLSAKRLGVFPTKFSKPEQTLYVWQRFNWANIGATATYLIRRRFSTLKLEWLPEFIDGVISDYKVSLIEADATMSKHPYITGSIPSSVGDMLYRFGTTVPLQTKTRVALPTLLEDEYVFSSKDGINDKWMVYCCPNDNWNSTFVGRVGHSALYEQEAKRLATQQAAQHTTTCEDGTHIKGTYTLVPKADLGGYDAIICVEDIKTYALGKGKLKTRAKHEVFELELPRTVISFTGWYGPGQCFGAPADAWKNSGKDYDGDFGFVSAIHADEEAIWEDCASWDVENVSNYKLGKSITPISEYSRAEMIVQSLQNVIGFSTKVQAMPFGKPADERMVFAVEMSHDTVASLEDKLAHYVKVGTDLYKVFIPNLIEMMQHLREAQTLMLHITTRQLAYLNWGNSSLAFKKVIPDFESQMDKKYLAYLKEQDEQVRKSGKKVESMYRVHIQPEVENSTISEIYRVARPLILKQFGGDVSAHGELRTGAKPNFLKVIETLPLSAFINWAPSVDDASLAKAKELYHKFCEVVPTIDQKSHKNWDDWKEQWQAEALKWADENFISLELAWFACWRVTHESGSEKSFGSFIFLTFPEGGMYIVQNKPGMFKHGTQLRVMLTGLQYNFNIPSRDLVNIPRFLCEVKHVMFRNKMRVVVCSLDPLPNQRQESGIPNLVGFCDSIDAKAVEYFGFTVPEPGVYTAIVKKFSRDPNRDLHDDKINTWQAGLTNI